MHNQKLDSAEHIEVLTVNHDQIMEMINGGPINQTIIVAAFYLYFLSEWSGLVDKNQYLHKLI